MHMARRCILRNNICISKGKITISLVNCEGFILDRNILYGNEEMRFRVSYSGIGVMKNNILWSGIGSIKLDMHDHLSSLERHDTPVEFPPKGKNTLICDPRLEVDDKGVVSFTDNSPAKSMGIKTLDLSNVGRQLS